MIQGLFLGLVLPSHKDRAFSDGLLPSKSSGPTEAVLSETVLQIQSCQKHVLSPPLSPLLHERTPDARKLVRATHRLVL